MSRTYLRGEIYYADLDPVVGSEQMGTRPVLILQNNVGNHFARTVIVAPITSRIHTKSKIPTHSYIGMIGSMKYPSVVMLEQLRTLPPEQKAKVEFLCNECCWFGCTDRKKCYETVSRKNLGEDCPEHYCTAPDAGQGYLFSKAMENPGFIGVDDIKNTYLPMGFSNFKIEGRGLGSAMILEFLLYYMTKPQYQIHVREHIYLDNMLDLF